MALVALLKVEAQVSLFATTWPFHAEMVRVQRLGFHEIRGFANEMVDRKKDERKFQEYTPGAYLTSVFGVSTLQKKVFYHPKKGETRSRCLY